MSAIPSDISQHQKERLQYIDFRLYFTGVINRQDLRLRFGLRDAAASRDLSLYRKLAKNNITYDTKAKNYAPTTRFKPLFQYLSDTTLSALLNGFGDELNFHPSNLISCESPTRLNYPHIENLAHITRAIYNEQAVKVRYRSLSNGLSEKEIIPFAFIDNGLRWHIRGYDRSKQRFADFVLNRIEKAVISGKRNPEETQEADFQWNHVITLHLVPHPSLKHAETIETEYAMSNGKLTVDVRAALAGYLLRHWNVDCSDNHSLNGLEHHLWLENKDALNVVDNLVLTPGFKNK